MPLANLLKILPGHRVLQEGNRVLLSVFKLFRSLFRRATSIGELIERVLLVFNCDAPGKRDMLPRDERTKLRTDPFRNIRQRTPAPDNEKIVAARVDELKDFSISILVILRAELGDIPLKKET